MAVCPGFRIESPETQPRGFMFVRPAWALSWRCKSSRNQAIESEAKRNCARETKRVKEAWRTIMGR